MFFVASSPASNKPRTAPTSVRRPISYRPARNFAPAPSTSSPNFGIPYTALGVPSNSGSLARSPKPQSVDKLVSADLTPKRRTADLTQKRRRATITTSHRTTTTLASYRSDASFASGTWSLFFYYLLKLYYRLRYRARAYIYTSICVYNQHFSKYQKKTPPDRHR